MGDETGPVQPYLSIFGGIWINVRRPADSSPKQVQVVNQLPGAAWPQCDIRPRRHEGADMAHRRVDDGRLMAAPKEEAASERAVPEAAFAPLHHSLGTRGCMVKVAEKCGRGGAESIPLPDRVNREIITA
jgi:hypothetical protein